MKENLRIAILFTLVTTIVFGVLYPLGVTGLAQLLFPAQSNGSLIVKDGRVVGSTLLGQMFSSPAYFHPRPSGAGNGYDASQSGSPNLAPTNHVLIDRVKGDVDKLHAENPGAPIPVDLVTTSGSGLDPEISPAAAEFQSPRLALVGNEIFQDVIFLGSEVYNLAAHGDLPGFKINRQILRLKRRHGVPWRVPPQRSAYARKQLLYAERFDHVVVRAGIEGGDLVTLGIAHGEHNDRRVRNAANFAASFDAPHARHVHVQQH